MTVDWEQLETELGADMVSAIRHLSSDEKDVRSQCPVRKVLAEVGAGFTRYI